MPLISAACSGSSFFAAADQRRGARPGEFVERGERAFNRLVAATTERAAHPVEQRALRLVTHHLRDVFPAGLGDEACEGQCFVHGVAREENGDIVVCIPTKLTRCYSLRSTAYFLSAHRTNAIAATILGRGAILREASERVKERTC